VRAKSPEASDEATQQGRSLLPVKINTLEINSISFYKEVQKFLF